MDKELANYASLSSHTEIPTSTDITENLNSIASLLKQRNFPEALDVCDSALEVFGQHEKLLEKKIKILCHQGRFEEAYDLAKKWKQREPQNATALKELKRLKIVIHALNDEDEEEEEEEDMAGVMEEASQEKDPQKRSSPEGMETKATHNSITTPATNNQHPPVSSISFSPLQAVTDEKEYACTFCDISFMLQEELETHCKSDLHKKKITSDEHQQWKYRGPPRGLSAEEYTLCKGYAEMSKCSFGDKCTQAHSQEELEEWKKRFTFRKQQIKVAREKQLHSSTYAEQLMEKLVNTDNPKTVMLQSVEYSKVHVNSDLKVNMTSKKCTSAWTFTITSKRCLQTVALLDDTNRTYFYIASISVGPKKTQKYQNLENHCQEWPNPDYSSRAVGEFVYRVKVVFKTDIYGTFRQTLIMDFGLEPVLSRELQVESAPITDTTKLTKEFLLTQSIRWHKDIITVVEFGLKPVPPTDIENHLLTKYCLPNIEKFRFSDHLMHPPSKETYRIWMHEMLYIEEWSQLEAISRFHLKTSLQLVNRFLLIPGMISGAKYAQSGELFARMTLEDKLSEDSAGGRLILTSSQVAWIAPYDQNNPNEKPQKVYEAIIEDKGKNFIFLRLSKACVDELNLSCDQEFSAQVQFQLNRLPKCEMHAAIDRLPTLDLVFPPHEVIPKDYWVTGSQDMSESVSKELNAKQKLAILGITTEDDIALPPLLLVGPYGTGKTFTLAQAAKQALSQDDTRILICTHSNSAADLYIKEFLHPMVKEGYLEARPLRVYYRHRWVQTVPEVVLQYCLRDDTGMHGNFRDPTVEDMEKHRVVITTLNTARYLSDLNLPKEFFSHIFLDEAAQAMECEMLIPLSISGPNTRIVLAGDHMQLSPEIYAAFGKQQGFQKSMLERLFELYPDNCPCKIMLCENYRSHSAIIEFTSDLFYDSQLTAASDQPPHPTYYPLTFFSASGEDVQHDNSTGFYNIAEVHEVIDRVDDLIKNWPSEWGESGEDSIGVLAPYMDQVLHIRSELRKRKMYRVSVERVFNVQGKQFRVVILTTVRTRHTCSSDSSQEDFVDYGFLSNIKLLNTAITRAQSLVIVVGDPLSLCLVGKCRKVWEYFVEMCNDNDSLYGITRNQLRTQLNTADLRKTYVLNPLAPEFVPNRLFHPVSADLAASATTGQHAHYQQHPYYVFGHRMVYPGAHGFPQQQMYHQPYFPIPYGYPPMIYKQGHLPHYLPGALHGGPHIQSRPVRGVHRHLSPLTVSPKSGRLDKDRPEIGPRAEAAFVNKKISSVNQRGRQIVYMPRLQAQYSPLYYQQYGGYYYVQEDPRIMALNQPHIRPPLIPQGPQIPHHQIPGGPYLSMVRTPSPQASLSEESLDDKRASQTSSPASQSYSPSSSPGSVKSGQQIQLLPNVKHVPMHLFNPRSGTPTSNARSSPIQRTDSPLSNVESVQNVSQKTEASQKIEAGYLRSSSPALELQERRGSANSPLARVIAASAQRQISPVPGEHASQQHVHHNRTVRTEETKTHNGEQLEEWRKNKKVPVGLKLHTGFSRQFSEDLETPTEIAELVKMIDETIEEQNESPADSSTGDESSKLNQSTLVNRINARGAAKRLHLNITHQSTDTTDSSPSTSPSGQDDNRPTYAGVLRRRLPSSQMDVDASLLEPQTPHTPAGFTTPGTEPDTDPLGILRNLNINASENQRTYKYFS